MSNLQILTQSIRIFENLYALNDLHIASGGKSKHQPSNFVRLDTTKALIAEIEKDNQHALKIIRGTNGGTYACEACHCLCHVDQPTVSFGGAPCILGNAPQPTATISLART